MDRPPDDFARALGDALDRFLKDRGISQKNASELIRVEHATLNTYTHDSPKGKRPLANAEVFVKACVELGFEFEYKGYKISAAATNGVGTRRKKTSEQLTFEYDRQFDLTDDKGTVSVRVKRPAGRVEVSLSLKAVS